MIILGEIMSAVFILCFSYTMVSSYLLRYFLDLNKVKSGDYEAKLFRSITPPLAILTETGVKIWWSRWIALGISLLALTFSCIIFSR